jgi:hypothetical protein
MFACGLQRGAGRRELCGVRWCLWAASKSGGQVWAKEGGRGEGWV